MPVTPTHPDIDPEPPGAAHPITAAPTSIAVFVGYTHPLGTAELLDRLNPAGIPHNRSTPAIELFSFADYERNLGGLFSSNVLADDVGNAVYHFFLNGGSTAYVIGLLPTPPANATEAQKAQFLTVTTAPSAVVGNIGFTAARPADRSPLDLKANPSDFLPVFEQDGALDKLPIFNLLVLPGVTDPEILSAALSFCERKQAFLIMDPPPPDAADADPAGGKWIGEFMENGLDADLPAPPKSPNGALYFPYLKAESPLTGEPLEIPPSGFVAGIYSRTDNRRGVWSAPAGLETLIPSTSGVVDSGIINEVRQGGLNPLGVNCLRQLPGIGTVVFGARTLTTQDKAFDQWKYVPVRRLALFIEQTLLRSLGWVVFEPNDEPPWASIRTTISAFMLSLFRQGAFQGATPSEAFQVQCDSTTTTQTDIDNGIVNVAVAFARLKPAEFVIMKIAQLAGQTQAEE